MKQSEKIDVIYRWILEQQNLPNMTMRLTNKIIRELVELADGEDYAGCLQIWEEMTPTESMWINHKFDTVNRKKVGEAIREARRLRGDVLKLSEKDQLREDARNAK